MRFSEAARKVIRLVVFVANLLISVLLSAQGDGAMAPLDNTSNYFLDRPDSTKWAVIITGPTVGEVSQSQFRQWSFSLHDILARDYGYSSDTITLLYDRGPPEFPGGDRVDGVANREGIEQALSDLAGRAETGDQVTLYLIGHGSGAEEEAKFNIVGPDITGVEFAAMLAQFEEQDLVIVNTTSASYGFSTSLSSEGRVVISSTRSPSERYDPIFSNYFIEALDGRNGDRDKNNRVSMLEAFEYAKNNVEAWYEEQGRLASEHAGLDDNGDALFALNPTVDAVDGRLAEIAYIDTLVDDSANLTPMGRELKAQMQDIERSVFILRGSKQDFLEAEYWQQLERLLIDLARVTGQFYEVAGSPEEEPIDIESQKEQTDEI